MPGDAKEVEPLVQADIDRRVASMVRTSEALGNEQKLATYYLNLIRIARKHGKTFNEIRHYFWLRFWLWNSDENVQIPFPWYDTLLEIGQFLDDVAQKAEGQVYWDIDQGWELEVCVFGGELFLQFQNPDDDEVYARLRVPREKAIASIQTLREHAESIIQSLSNVIGRDLWTKYVDWPEFSIEK